MNSSKSPGDKAGAGARLEYERRKKSREDEVRKKHPHLGGLMLALQEPPQHETRWAKGAEGEEMVAKELEKRCSNETVILFHDRRIPKSRANIDHIAITAKGVWVIDSKRYKGKITVDKPWRGSERLLVNGWDKTSLVGGLIRQKGLVRDVVAAKFSGVPIHGVLCFVGSDWGLFQKPMTIGGAKIMWPKAVAKELNEAGPLKQEHMLMIANLINRTFPPYSK